MKEIIEDLKELLEKAENEHGLIITNIELNTEHIRDCSGKGIYVRIRPELTIESVTQID
jgi:hypothetical protein